MNCMHFVNIIKFNNDVLKIFIIIKYAERMHIKHIITKSCDIDDYTFIIRRYISILIVWWCNINSLNLIHA